MTQPYNELVGIQATFSRVTHRYNVTMMYRWQGNGKKAQTGSMRSYDMRRETPVKRVCSNLREVYAPVIERVWRKSTPTSFIEYLQLKGGMAPYNTGQGGGWKLWAEL